MAKAGTPPHTHTGIANSVEKTDCNANPRCTGIVDTATELKWNEMVCRKRRENKTPRTQPPAKS